MAILQSIPQFIPETQGFADSNRCCRASYETITLSNPRNVLIDDIRFPDATTPPVDWKRGYTVGITALAFRCANFRDNPFTSPLSVKKRLPFVRFETSVIKGKGEQDDRKDGSETFLVRGTTCNQRQFLYGLTLRGKAMSYEIVSTLKRAGVEVAASVSLRMRRLNTSTLISVRQNSCRWSFMFPFRQSYVRRHAPGSHAGWQPWPMR
ncbi:hypothetical protein [Duncaniella dubosii]|uniref:hypothetical protein n=1 Tax=Duncaniella dubosii TaxID=2518971 RepID=UPI003F66FEF4